MALFNWAFLKKSVFAGGIIGLSLTPIGIISKYRSIEDDLDISYLKKNLDYLSGKYADKFTISELAKEVFQINEMMPSISDVFAEDLALLAVQHSPLHKQQYLSLVNEEKKAFENAFNKYFSTNNKTQKFYDSKGGNREIMQKRELTNKAIEIFKSEILDFDQDNFTINNYSDKLQPLKNNHHISETIINNDENWKNIGFWAQDNGRYNQDPDFFKSKFDFINFAHKIWFKEVKPFYVWMSLWKHKENAKKHELTSLWNEEELKKEKVNLDGASYSFPYYSTDSLNKFQNFFQEKIAKHNSSDTIFIPKGFTDDSSTSIFVEGQNMYKNLYIKFAAAANYKLQKKLQKSNNDSSGSNSDKWINKLEKTHTVTSYKQPTELFQFKSSESSESSDIKARIPIKKELIKDTSNQTKNEIADLVEIKDSPWVFIRNQAGIHALAVDYENIDVHAKKEDNKKNFYEHFQYRTLQLKYKKQLSLSQTLDIDINQVIKSFKNYLSQNFSRLIIKYYLDSATKPQSGFFGANVSNEFSSFKDSFEFKEELQEIKRKYWFKRNIRESLIGVYAKTSWNVKSDDDKKFEHPKVQHGLAGVLPFKLNTEESGKESYLFEDLEKLYDLYSANKVATTNSDENSESLAEKYKKKEKEYKNKVGAFIDGLNLTISKDTANVASNRIFTNNYYIDRIIDKFLDKPEVFNEFLFKYMLKSDYLGKSILGKGFIEINENFGIKVPENYVLNSNKETTKEVIDKVENSETDNEKVKKVFGKLNEKVVNSYYSKYLLENESSSPWDAAKFGGSLLAESSESTSEEKLREKLTKLSKTAFEEQMLFGNSELKNKHHKFLTTFSYLIANNFENLIKYLASKISYKQDAYVIFSNIQNKKHEVSIPEKGFKNPFLNYEGLKSDNYKTSIKNIYKYLSSVNFKDSSDSSDSSSTKTKVSDNFIYLGFYNGSNNLAANLSEQDRKDLLSSSLYRFGKDNKEMNKYVLRINSEQEWKQIVEAVEKAVSKSTEDEKKLIQNLKMNFIYIKKDDSTQLKTLTLNEKKNLLSAYLMKHKVEITSSQIENSKYKDVFLTDPTKNYNPTGSTHSEKTSSESSYQEILKKSYFEKNKDVKFKDNPSDTKFTLFQINLDDVKDFDSFKTFVNSNMSSEVFWTWVVNMSLLREVQDLAIQEFSASSDKLSAYDSRWLEQGNNKFFK